MMDFILDYWQLIFAILVLFSVCIIFIRAWFTLPSDVQMAKVREWLLFCVVLCEKEMGSNTGKLKLRYAWDMFLDKFPAVAKVITFEMFSNMVDDALREMRHIIETSPSAKRYIEGEDNGYL